MWESQHLTTLWASTACYRDNFTIFYHSLFHRKMFIHILVRCYLCPIWPVLPLNLTFIFIFFATVISNPALYILLTFYIPNLTYIFLSLCQLSKESMQVWGPLWHFIRSLFFHGEELLARCPTSNLEDHPLSAVCDCVLNIFRATLHIWRLSHPSLAWGRAMPLWQGTHLTIFLCIIIHSSPILCSKGIFYLCKWNVCTEIFIFCLINATLRNGCLVLAPLLYFFQ
jgi:hypothetical protein